MTRYKSGLFGKSDAPSPLESFDSHYRRERSRRLMSRYGRAPRVGEGGNGTGDGGEEARDDTAVETLTRAATADRAHPEGRSVLRERVVRDWDAAPSGDAGPEPAAAPSPPPDPAPGPDPAATADDRAAPEADRAEDEMPLVEAGSFSVQDGGAMPGEDSLEEDVSLINEPRRPPSQEDRRDAAVEEFLAMIDRTYRPPSPPGPDEALEGRAVEVDPVDVIADIVEMSAGDTEASYDDVPPDATPVVLNAVVPPPEELGARGASIEAAGLGLAVFEAFRAEVTKGGIEVSAQPSRYVHPNTPPDSRFTQVVSDFVFLALHPRVGVSNQRFKMRLTVEVNHNDIRTAKINFVGDESNELYASSFSVGFTASELSLPKEAMCKIRYDFAGRWDPAGSGDYTFDGTVDVWADGSVHFQQMRSDTDSSTFGSEKVKVVRIVSAKRISVRPLPAKTRRGRTHAVMFEKPKQAEISDDQARALKAFIGTIPATDLDLVRQGRVPVVVDGFASTTGSVSDNQALARDRREAAMAFLTDQIGSGITFTGKAEGELASGRPDGTEAAEDRRATVTIWTFHDP